MGGGCRTPRRSSGRAGGARAAGLVKMLIGALMFLIFVPRWVWTAALGIVLISAGFLLWRFS